MKPIYTLFTLISVFLTSSAAFSQLSINTTDVNATAMATELVGPGVTVVSAQLMCPDGASGYFSNGGTTNIGMGNGIILSTGAAIDAVGPNNSSTTSTNWNAAGDPQLSAFTAPFDTYDACYLEVEFIPSGDVFQFNYVFASEEYNEYVCSIFNDAFAIFISGPGMSNVNIGTIPGTDTPVAINTVNNGSPGSNGNPSNCAPGGLDNTAYFVNNVGGSTIEYDGFTVPLTAQVAVMPGQTYTLKIAIADGADGAFDTALFIEGESFFSPSCIVNAGTISSESPASFCKSNLEADNIFEVNLEGANGENGLFVVTWEDGEIIAVSSSNEVDLSGIPGNGTCLFWHLSWNGEIMGAEVGMNANDITGDCFNLSNSIAVEEQFANGGEISTDDETTFCVGDGIDDIVNVTLTGTNGANGQMTAWVITDADLNILNITSESTFNFEGADEGACLIWHLGWVGTLNGAVVGANAADLSGDCFDLSNPITVNRENCEEECVVDGGTISTESPTTVFCKSDGEPNVFTIDLEGAVGENGVYVVTFLDGEIILVSESNTFDLEGVPGNGTCLFWHLSWNGELMGAEVGMNANDITGECFDLSNPIEVEEQFANGGDISTDSETTFCAEDGGTVAVSVSNDGGANGQTVVWVITDADLNILELGGMPPFEFAEAGSYLIWRLGYVGELNGATVGANAADLSGDCFDLSNPIEVTVEVCEPVCDADGGTISTESPTTVFCKSDGSPDVFVIDLEGAVGENGAYVVTFLNGDIILISESNTFDLEGVPGNGTCLFWHLSWNGDIMGAEVGMNANDITGECFDLSNSIEVEEQFANGGNISTTSETAFCEEDGGSIEVSVSNAGGANGQTVVWVITDADLNILELGGMPPFEFAEAGSFLIWRLGYVGGLNGAAEGANAADLSGDCFDLSNPIAVEVEDCDGSGSVDDGDCYATELISYIQGEKSNNGPIDANRTNPLKALGQPERTDAMVFVTLGYGGSLTLGFGGSVPNLDGPDLEIVETSFGTPGCAAYPEYADVYVSQNGINFEYAGTVCKGQPFIDISDAGNFAFITQVRISNNNNLTSTPDAYDVDGVVAIHNCTGADGGFIVQNSYTGNSHVQSFPNPTRGDANITYGIPQTGRAVLEIYDASGRKVQELLNEELLGGTEYRLTFDGHHLPQGLYMIRLSSDTQVAVSKFMITK